MILASKVYLKNPKHADKILPLKKTGQFYTFHGQTDSDPVFKTPESLTNLTQILVFSTLLPCHSVNYHQISFKDKLTKFLTDFSHLFFLIEEDFHTSASFRNY